MSTMTAYQTLLVEFTPRPIREDSQYRRAMRHVERLMRKPKLSRAEGELLELLATLVEQYEALEHPTPAASHRELLAHLIDARGVTQAEVARGSGVPRSVISSVLAGRRKLSQKNIACLAAYFHVSAAAFLESAG